MHKPIFVLTMNRDYVPSSEDVFEMVSNHYDYVTETKNYTIDHLRNQLTDMFGTVKEENQIFTVKKEPIEKYLKRIATKIRSHTRKLEFDKIEFWKTQLIYETMIESSAFVIDGYYVEGYELATYLYNHLNHNNETSFTNNEISLTNNEISFAFAEVYDTHY